MYQYIAGRVTDLSQMSWLHVLFFFCQQKKEIMRYEKHIFHLFNFSYSSWDMYHWWEVMEEDIKAVNTSLCCSPASEKQTESYSGG